MLKVLLIDNTLEDVPTHPDLSIELATSYTSACAALEREPFQAVVFNLHPATQSMVEFLQAKAQGSPLMLARCSDEDESSGGDEASTTASTTPKELSATELLPLLTEILQALTNPKPMFH